MPNVLQIADGNLRTLLILTKIIIMSIRAEDLRDELSEFLIFLADEMHYEIMFPDTIIEQYFDHLAEPPESP